MAIFGTSKNTGGTQERKAGARKRSARAEKLASGAAHETIRAPWFSEKALLLAERGVYVFAVPERATKAAVAGAILELYKVAPRKIRIVNLPGQRASKRARGGKAVRARRRKAYVYLAKGDTIQFA